MVDRSKARWTTPQSIPLDAKSSGPKVLAAGLWRCTTSSLQTSFEELLSPPLAPSMHGSYIFTSMSQMKLCIRATAETDKPKRQKILREVFTGYNASSDFPGMAFVDDLIEMYPDMKVLLNKRKDGKAWEKSVNESLRFFGTWTYMVLTFWSSQSWYHWRMYREYEQLARRRFGSEVDIWSASYYDLHNEWVKTVCDEHGRKFLEWEPSLSWEPLCDFLGMSVPATAFPRTNETAEMVKGRRLLVLRGVVYWILVLGGIWLVWKLLAQNQYW